MAKTSSSKRTDISAATDSTVENTVVPSPLSMKATPVAIAANSTTAAAHLRESPPPLPPTQMQRKQKQMEQTDCGGRTTVGGTTPHSGRRRKSLPGVFKKAVTGFVGRTARASSRDAGCHSVDISRAGPILESPVLVMERAISETNLVVNAHQRSELRPSLRTHKGRKYPEQENQDRPFSISDLFNEYAAHSTSAPASGVLGIVGMFGVCDGHGGAQCSTFVSKHLPIYTASSSAWAKLRVVSGSDGAASKSQADVAAEAAATGAWDTMSDAGDHSRGDDHRGDGVQEEKNADDASTTAVADGGVSNERARGVNGTGGIGALLSEVMKEALLDGFRRTDEHFNKRANERNENSGSTAVVALVCGSCVVMANVGDSAALFYNDNYYLGRDGAFWAQTKVHDRTNADEVERVKAAGGVIHENGRVFGRLQPTRSFGNRDVRRDGSVINAVPEIVVHRIKPTTGSSFVVLGSDGLFSLRVQEIIDIVRAEDAHVRKKASSALKPSKTARKLADSALKKTGDDVTAVVVLFS